MANAAKMSKATQEYFMRVRQNELYSPSPYQFDAAAARMIGKTYGAIDAFVMQQLKKKLPLAYWLIKKHILPYRYIGKIFGLSIQERAIEYGKKEIKIFSHKREIGTMIIVGPKMV